jgi:hypothetical protein
MMDMVLSSLSSLGSVKWDLGQISYWFDSFKSHFANVCNFILYDLSFEMLILGSEMCI